MDRKDIYFETSPMCTLNVAVGVMNRDSKTSLTQQRSNL